MSYYIVAKNKKTAVKKLPKFLKDYSIQNIKKLT